MYGGDLHENGRLTYVKRIAPCRTLIWMAISYLKTDHWSIFKELSCHHVIMSSCHHVIMSSCHHVIMSSCHLVILSSCHHAIMSSCHHVILSSCHLVIMASWHHVIMSSCKKILLKTSAFCIGLFCNKILRRKVSRFFNVYQDLLGWKH